MLRIPLAALLAAIGGPAAPPSLIEAICRRVDRAGPVGLRPVRGPDGGVSRGGCWPGAIPAGVRPPYAQAIEVGSRLYRTTGGPEYLERTTYRITTFATTSGAAWSYAREIRSLLDGRAFRTRDGRSTGGVRLFFPGVREIPHGPGPGGTRIWRFDDVYRAFAVRGGVSR